ncbi:hypothetical protein B738_05081 [Photorhabdus temperata subsp. temperata M1021]|nr:hypothetical protein B738_05081 [Photorhabdus temperata subsp. temperata M1021]
MSVGKIQPVDEHLAYEWIARPVCHNAAFNYYTR